jgi:hypothetical protein
MLPTIPILALLLALSTPSRACLRHKGTAPWDDTLPFEATITDNGVVTCWISKTYASHSTEQRHTPPDDANLAWEFQPWHFECLRGYGARAEVGRRSYSYRAHGQDFSWVADIREDVQGEAYVYGKELFCKGRSKDDGKNGKGRRKR